MALLFSNFRHTLILNKQKKNLGRFKEKLVKITKMSTV